jgi:hypothetical protein
MNDIQKRFMLFLIGCIGMRSIFVYLAKTIPTNYLQIMGYISILPAIGFAYIFFTDTRKTGPEVLGGKIWWNDLRPIHSALYFLFAYFAINKSRHSWKFLLVDVLIGLISFLVYHYKSGNFSKLIK